MGRRPQGNAAMTNTERWRRWYAKQHPTKSNDKPVDAEVDALKAEIAALKAELDTARQTKPNDNPSAGIDKAALDRAQEGDVLNWVDAETGDGLGDLEAEAPAGTYAVYNRGFWAGLRTQTKGGSRATRAKQLGEFATLEEAKAACQEHARAHPA